jgi:hypothetical protein
MKPNRKPAKSNAPPINAARTPPTYLGEQDESGVWRSFAPAPLVRAWVQAAILEETGLLHNPDHAHLLNADFEVLWAAGGFESKMRRVVGQCEEVVFRASAWAKLRQEEQMCQWFGRVPDFLITLDASYATECSEAEWCALIEHEMYHIGQKHEFGAPVFMRDGRPKLAIRGHDVEEFIGVVRRYGMGSPDSSVARLVSAANTEPEVSRIRMSQACGTCLLRAA